MVLSILELGKTTVPVDSASYLFFSFCYSALLAISFLSPVSEFFVVLNLFLFLGFWGKATFYLDGGLRFPEISIDVPTALLNRALLYSAGFALLNIVCTLVTRYRSSYIKIPTLRVPKLSSSWIFILVISLALLACAWANQYYAILRVGVPAKFHFPFPISVLFSWIMGPGAAFVFFMFSPLITLFSGAMILIVAMAFSVSTLSRNGMMYFAFPLISKFFKTRHSLWSYLLMAGIAFALFLAIFMGVYESRWQAYFHRPAHESIEKQRPDDQLLNLLLTRWVGLEGVVVALNNPSDDLFYKLLVDRPGPDSGTVYQKETKMDWAGTKKLYFFTIPGPAGLALFANSFWLRCLGFFVYSLLLIFSYLVCERLIPTGLARSVVIWWTAQTVAQMSLFYRYNLLIYFAYLAIPLGILIIGALLFGRFGQRGSAQKSPP
jgi:hypothetical protein